MTFTDSPRVIYHKNTLEQVICQVRFPPILRIDAEVPSAFQELIRKDYPLYSANPQGPAELPAEIVSQMPPEIRQLMSMPGTSRNHEFSTRDKKWTVNLTSDFLALTAREYDRWENFRRHLEAPFGALVQAYSPAFFSRVGLRYRNVIRRSRPGLEGAEWSDLLQPYIVGVLAAPGISETTVQTTTNNAIIQLDDAWGAVRIVHGLVQDDTSKETVYLIDSDFYNEETTETEDAIKKLDYFNGQGRRLFRWFILDRLHAALEPEPIQ